MDKINPLRVFVEAARLKSFSSAARQLLLTRDQASKQVARLEAELGTTLFVRSTRQVTLTSAGEALFERAETVLQMLDEALCDVRSLAEGPRGPLRVNVPMSFGQRYIAPLLPAFHAAYPEVQLRLDLDDAIVDPKTSGADLILRVAQLPEHLDLVARPIATAPRWLVATPAYLDAAGLPTHPSQLARHACLHYGDARSAQTWQFRSAPAQPADAPPQVHGVAIRGPVCSNNGDVLLTAALGGLGLTVLPAFMLREHLATGRLQRVLPHWAVTPDIGLFALYSKEVKSSPTLRAFIHVVESGLRDTLGQDEL